MFSIARRCSNGITVVLLGILTASCYGASGSTEEICNGIDDNDNGVVDEPFVDDAGEYAFIDNCGGCGINCETVFPQAEAVACDSSEAGYACKIVSCPEGTHLVDDMACIKIRDVTCLPCTSDDDCRVADPGAACLPLPAGGQKCLSGCETDQACDDGYSCESIGEGKYCTPKSGTCACTPKSAGQTFGCWLRNPAGDYSCYGEKVCLEDTFSDCVPIHEERCDGEDNNCDGRIDEGFKQGDFYLSEDHCGACHHPCKTLAPNTVADCRMVDGTPTCVRACADNHVDLDGLTLNGCECFKVNAVWPPLSFGGDMDCDGQVDTTDAFIFVSKTGDDSNPGTLEAPVATINHGLRMASAQAPTVVVAQGIYDEVVDIVPGISLFGGYRADFGDQNPDLFEVQITGTPPSKGHPSLRARGIDVPTEVAALSIIGSNAETAGDGSTAMLVIDSTESLMLHTLRVVSGSGADGADGRSSAQIMKDVQGQEISSLDGLSGSPGEAGIDIGTSECVDISLLGGDGGRKTCSITGKNVSGGNGGETGCPTTGCEAGEACPNGGCDDFMTGDGCDFDTMKSLAVPNSPAEDGHGDAGGLAGSVTYDAPTTRDGENYCADDPSLQREGGNGSAGSPGNDGQGGAGCNILEGQFDPDTGMWRSLSGDTGDAGGDGSGGGGGTQGNSYDVLPWNSIVSQLDATDQLGGSGGGGGSGGCGALGAEQGQGGGNTIGMAVILTDDGRGPDVRNIRVIPARAGNGGSGGMGAAGGVPGNGGSGGEGNHWCARRGGRGGDGGEGGDGGGGGGGCGGSISGFHVVATLLVDGNQYLETLKNRNHVDPLPSPGSPGSGGFSPGNPGGDGLNGDAKSFRLYSYAD